MKNLDPADSVAALFGAKTRKLRERAGMTQQELGERVYVTHTRIAKIELATEPPGWKLAERLDESLNASGELVELWPHLTPNPYPDYAKRYMALQAEAMVLHGFWPVIPGLLQTQGFARAQIEAGRIYTGLDVDEAVETRLNRQRRLGDGGLWLWAVIDEAALHRGVGGPAVMRDQLAHLLVMAELPRVSIRICPMDRVDPAMLTGSSLFTTTSDGEQSLYLEGRFGVLVQDLRDIARYRIAYDRTQAGALSREESVALVRKVMEERYPCETPSDPT
ncbi:helix-turn-helix domain-containing protein [Actinacidiphila rubida]|uniref:DNA-binding transcriptional regulator, XRE-family HTH domain n=1 Tax=Actinacidiphila rubida TaxID=310780 RepID=A0A1H8QZE9_9ACTN|nr:helix-turn-helix transcriptional regulator [Actinacidiphila rubida]SEO59248.1 DNA-binding transcriptional regulator, XRE-family HTH domain [Actinacidiphila rubida]